MEQTKEPIRIELPELYPMVTTLDGHIVLVTLEQAKAVEQAIKKGLRKSKRNSVLKKIKRALTC
jgi:hypothetical protein